MNDPTIDCEIFLIWGKDIMGYINERFESRYSKKKQCFIKFIVLLQFFFQTAAELKIYLGNVTH